MKSTLFLALSLGAALGGLATHWTLAAPTASTAPKAATAAKTYPDQSTVAAKTPFVKASAAAAKGALDAKNISGAQKLIGKPGAFQGTVSTVYSPKNHDVVVLDFDPEFRQAMTAIVRPSAYGKLPSLEALKGKHILVSGKFEAYKGKPEIEVSEPSQIKLLP